MADKLSAAQIKHGYKDGWSEVTHEWPSPECHEALMDHLRKGDPVDVANFCAFLWYHKLSTTYCGKGWRSPEQFAEELKPTMEFLRYLITSEVAEQHLKGCRCWICAIQGDAKRDLTRLQTLIKRSLEK
jgi:hypothetical protein